MNPEQQKWNGVERRAPARSWPAWRWTAPRDKPSRAYSRESEVPGYKEAVRKFLSETAAA